MLKRKIEDPLAGVSTQFLAFWCGPLFCLEWKLNNPIHRCDPQTKGISFAGASLVEKARSNLFLARSWSFLWSQGPKRFAIAWLFPGESSSFCKTN